MKLFATVIIFLAVSSLSSVTTSIADDKTDVILRKFEVVSAFAADLCPSQSGKKLDGIQIKLDLADKNGNGLRPVYFWAKCWFVPKKKRP